MSLMPPESTERGFILHCRSELRRMSVCAMERRRHRARHEPESPPAAEISAEWIFTLFRLLLTAPFTFTTPRCREPGIFDTRCFSAEIRRDRRFETFVSGTLRFAAARRRAVSSFAPLNTRRLLSHPTSPPPPRHAVSSCCACCAERQRRGEAKKDAAAMKRRCLRKMR